jgi:hypothetical protein
MKDYQVSRHNCNKAGLKLKLAFIGRVRKPQAFTNLAPTVLPVSYKNQKNAWMDSEIFRGSFFDEFVPSTEQFLKSLNLPRKQSLSLIMRHLILMRMN